MPVMMFAKNRKLHARRGERPVSNLPGASRGIVLIDALIAVVIFSIGIVGMVQLLASASKLSGDAQYRTDAAMFADQAISNMWTYDPATVATDYASPSGSAYLAWKASVTCGTASASTHDCLPGVAANPPTIVIKPVTDTGITNNFLVTVTVNWKSPNDLGPHNYVSTTQIGP